MAEIDMLEELSCRGAVTHVRRAPRRHAFRYPLWMLYVELDRPHAAASFRPRFLASVDRGHLLTREAVRARVAAAGLAKAGAAPLRVFALTQPRSLGVSFNPVNFYFCFAGDRLAAVLADVTNTPWGERHGYVLRPDPRGDAPGTRSFRFAKRFHVSPFLPMGGCYVLRLKISGGALRIAMRFVGGAAPFSACLSLRTRPLTRTEVLRCALRHPAQGALTLARIYWQAGRLFLKRAPFHAHPGKLGAVEEATGR